MPRDGPHAAESCIQLERHPDVTLHEVMFDSRGHLASRAVHKEHCAQRVTWALRLCDKKEYSPPTYFLWLLLFSSSFSPLSSLLAPRTSPGLALQWHQTVIYFDCSPSIVELLFFSYNFVQTLPF